MKISMMHLNPLLMNKKKSKLMLQRSLCFVERNVKELIELLTHCLGPKACYTPSGKKPVDDRSRLFAMYHKKTRNLVKKTVET